MPFTRKRPVPGAPRADASDRASDLWQVLDALGVDPAEHFASLLLDGSDADEKRKDEAAKQLLPYCYARKATQSVVDAQEQRVGYVLCEGKSLT